MIDLLDVCQAELDRRIERVIKIDDSILNIANARLSQFEIEKF